MIGFNGGLVGKLRDSVSSQSNPGVWTAREQSIYKAISGKWPTAPVPGDPFPAAYRSLIDNFASTKYFVDATTGSDSNAGTSFATAFATIGKAITTASSGHMIVVYPGSYTNNTTGYFPGYFYSNHLIGDASKSLQIVCAPGQVSISGSNTGARDYHAVSFGNADSKIYGAILNRNNGGRLNNYDTAFLGRDSELVRGQIINCAIRETNANGGFGLIYDNSNTAWTIDSCLLIGTTFLGNYSGGTVATVKNSASNVSPSILGNMTNNGFNKTINGNWSVDSISYGVYSGTYSWILSTFTYP
jgi:hypothetical protein